MEYSERILEIFTNRGLSSYRVAKEIGVTTNLFTAWKKKTTSKIQSCTLVLIADYLDCSVDYLLGRTEDPTPPIKKESLSEGAGSVAGSD